MIITGHAAKGMPCFMSRKTSHFQPGESIAIVSILCYPIIVEI